MATQNALCYTRTLKSIEPPFMLRCKGRKDGFLWWPCGSSTVPVMQSPSARFLRDPILLKTIPLLLWQYWGSSRAMCSAHKLFFRIKSSLSSPDRWGNEAWNAGPSCWNHRILLFYRQQHWHLEKSRATQATHALQWLGWGSFPTKTQLALLSLRPGHCSVQSPCALLCFLLSQPHWPPCWSSDTPYGCSPQGLCTRCLFGLECCLPRYSHQLVPAYLSLPQRDPNLSVLHPFQLLYSLAKTCLETTPSPPEAASLLHDLPSSMNPGHPSISLRPCSWDQLKVMCVREAECALGSLAWKCTGDVNQPVEIKCLWNTQWTHLQATRKA